MHSIVSVFNFSLTIFGLLLNFLAGGRPHVRSTHVTSRTLRIRSVKFSAWLVPYRICQAIIFISWMVFLFLGWFSFGGRGTALYFGNTLICALIRLRLLSLDSLVRVKFRVIILIRLMLIFYTISKMLNGSLYILN